MPNNADSVGYIFMEFHYIHPELLRRQVHVLVVGCGGNGSAIAAGLAYLYQVLLVYGHPEGLHVTLLDPEVVSPTNCVRQPFSRSEIGLYPMLLRNVEDAKRLLA